MSFNTLNNYYPIIMAFAAAMIGIFGETKNEDGKGWRRVTRLGWLMTLFAVGSLILGVLKTIQMTAEAVDAAQIRVFAYRQVGGGLGRIFRHTVIAPLSASPTNEQFFDLITTPDYLDRLSQKGVYFPFKIGKGEQAEFVRPDFEFWVEDIVAGQALINDALVKYQGQLDAKAVSLITQLLQNRFFLNDYRFQFESNMQDLVPTFMRQQNVKMSYLGTWYFGGSYNDHTQSVKDNDFTAFIEFVRIAKELSEHMNHNGKRSVNLFRP